MNRHERIFLVAVVVCAVVFSAFSLGHARDWLVARRVEPGVAGQARDVDLDQVKRLIRQQRLSDHEALFYSTTDERKRREDGG